MLGKNNLYFNYKCTCFCDNLVGIVSRKITVGISGLILVRFSYTIEFKMEITRNYNNKE